MCYSGTSTKLRTKEMELNTYCMLSATAKPSENLRIKNESGGASVITKPRSEPLYQN